MDIVHADAFRLTKRMEYGILDTTGCGQCRYEDNRCTATAAVHASGKKAEVSTLSLDSKNNFIKKKQSHICV